MKIIYIIQILTLLMGSSSCKSEEVNPGTGPEVEPPVVANDSTNAIYRQFFFSGTHNSYSGNQNGMKREGIKTQLARGLRFFEFDLFSFYTENLLTKEYTENAEIIVFEYAEKPYSLSFNQANGRVSITELESHTSVFDNTANPWAKGERKFVVTPYEGKLYITTLHTNSGGLSLFEFSGSDLRQFKTEQLAVSNAKVSVFPFQQKLYVAIHDLIKESLSIYNFNIQAEEDLLAEPLLRVSAVAKEETVTPFVQNDELSLFKHNQKYVSSFSVTPLVTTDGAWSALSEIRTNSSKLLGKVNAVFSNDRLFLNTYLASGTMKSFQFVMDNGKPNLVEEHASEIDLLSGAELSLYPSGSGFYAVLHNASKVQMLKVHIGDLVLGHDAPGDEVDLEVDNPQSTLLKDWLDYIAEWSDNNPNHEPLFIMTELKNYEHWMADAKWRNIIRLMQDEFGSKLRYHSSSGFYNEALVDTSKIVDGQTLYFMDENGSKEGGLLGKVVLYIQPNNNITQSNYTNDFEPFNTTDGVLQANFLQLKNYRVNNKLVSPDWRKPENYGNDVGRFIDNKDDSYISRIFHMQSALGDGQYQNIHCTDVMFAVSDRPFDNGTYARYVQEQKVKNSLQQVAGCQ